MGRWRDGSLTLFLGLVFLEFEAAGRWERLSNFSKCQPLNSTGSAILESLSDVRCITVASTGRIITASRDMTMRLWDQAPGVANGAYICHKTVHHASWLTSLCVLPPIPNAANELLRIAGGIVAGCKDGQIQVHDSDGNVLFVLPGHSGQVSSVSTTSAGLLVSGSWDGSMRVWDLSIKVYLPTGWL